MVYTFAKRIEQLTPSLILDISAQAKSDPEVINLSAGEPDFPTPDPVKEAGITAIRENFTRYTAGFGIPELRQAVAKRIGRDTGTERVPDETVISNGGKHALSSTILALIDAGDRVLLPTPAYPSYVDMVHLAQGEVITLPTTLENGFRITPAQLDAALSTDPKLLIMNSPCNPTGAVYERRHYDALFPSIKESGVLVISDEIYDEYLYDGRGHVSLASYPEICDKVILVNGVSKTFSMTGWRLGWAAAHPEIIQKVGMLQSQMMSSPCSISQKAALEAVSRPMDEFKPVLEQFQKRRDRAYQMLTDIPGVKCSRPEGAFYILPDVSAYLPPPQPGDENQRSLELARYLIREHKVAVVPGCIFGDDDYVRISFAASMEDVEEGIKRLAKGLEGYRK